jgi:hypothetical protein
MPVYREQIWRRRPRAGRWHPGLSVSGSNTLAALGRSFASSHCKTPTVAIANPAGLSESPAFDRSPTAPLSQSRGLSESAVVDRSTRLSLATINGSDRSTVESNSPAVATSSASGLTDATNRETLASRNIASLYGRDDTAASSAAGTRSIMVGMGLDAGTTWDGGVLIVAPETVRLSRISAIIRQRPIVSANIYHRPSSQR